MLGRIDGLLVIARRIVTGGDDGANVEPSAYDELSAMEWARQCDDHLSPARHGVANMRRFEFALNLH